MYLYINELLTYLPQGKLTTYGDLAKLVGCPYSSRPVGKILHDNQEPDRYPCYKVVGSDGSLTGYALGLAEKIKRLQVDGIKVVDNRVSGWPESRWQPRLYSYFLAMPLPVKYQSVFRQLSNKISSSLPGDYLWRAQKEESAHVTLLYFGNIDFSRLAEIVGKLRLWEQTSREPWSISCAGLKWFERRDERIGYLAVQVGSSNCTTLYQDLSQTVGLVSANEVFVPHLTVGRVKNTSPVLREEVGVDYVFSWPVERIRLYCSIDENRQVPLVDFDLNKTGGRTRT